MHGVADPYPIQGMAHIFGANFQPLLRIIHKFGKPIGEKKVTMTALVV